MPVTAAPWATIADVTTVTGKTVDAPGLAIAIVDIEMATGLISSVPRVFISMRDRYWLKLAVCYQAAWNPAQPDKLELKDVSSASQDGQSATYKADAHVLAPLAVRAIKRLSWKGSRTMLPVGYGESVRRGNPLAGNTQPLPQYIGGDPLTDGSDNNQSFNPL